MSKERRRAREAREAAAAVEAERLAAQQRARPKAAARTTAPKGSATARRVPRNEQPTVYRQRRFPPLPWRLKLALGLGWLTVVLLGAYLAPTWLGRLGIAVIATFCLPLVVVIVRDPSRRTR